MESCRVFSNIEWVFLRDHGRRIYSESLQAQVFTGLQSALFRNIDALIIATPSSKHADLITAGLAADLPMYIEKPVVTNSPITGFEAFSFASRHNPTNSSWL